MPPQSCSSALCNALTFSHHSVFPVCLGSAPMVCAARIYFKVSKPLYRYSLSCVRKTRTEKTNGSAHAKVSCKLSRSNHISDSLLNTSVLNIAMYEQNSELLTAPLDTRYEQCIKGIPLSGRPNYFVNTTGLLSPPRPQVVGTPPRLFF